VGILFENNKKEVAEVRRLLRKRAKGVYNYLGYTKEGE